MVTYSTLIVEDELMIAELMARYLRERDHKVAGIAVDVKEAKKLYSRHEPDIVLLDIRLRGKESGIDFAHYLQRQANPPPFIYLTSQTDVATVDAVTETLPAGYLTKPVRPSDLHAAISLAMRRRRIRPIKEQTLQVSDGYREITVNIKDILFLEAEHVYVRVHMSNGEAYLLRKSLASLARSLPAKDFCRVHRSHMINRRWVKGWNDQCVQVSNRKLPVSRSRKQEVNAWLSVG